MNSFISINLRYFNLVRKQTNTNIGRRVDNHLNSKPSISPRNNTRTNLVNMADVNQQKENKFKQIFDQSTVDLRKKIFFSLKILFH